jgi:hypothetical protein
MSVIDLANPDSDLIRWLGEAPERCFWCGNPLDPVTVFWYASSGHVALHPRCAEELGCVLIFESRRAQMVETGQNVQAGLTCMSGRDDPKVVRLRRGRGK